MSFAKHKELLAKMEAQAKKIEVSSKAAQSASEALKQLKAEAVKDADFTLRLESLTTACQTPLNTLVTAAATFKIEKDAYQSRVSQSSPRVIQLTGNAQWEASRPIPLLKSVP